MKINIKDIITLSDDKKYSVVSKTIIEDKSYLYLLDINDYSNVKFCIEEKNGDNIEVEEIEDGKIIELLLPIFIKETEKALKNE